MPFHLPSQPMQGNFVISSNISSLTLHVCTIINTKLANCLDYNCYCINIFTIFRLTFPTALVVYMTINVAIRCK